MFHLVDPPSLRRDVRRCDAAVDEMSSGAGHGILSEQNPTPFIRWTRLVLHVFMQPWFAALAIARGPRIKGV